VFAFPELGGKGEGMKIDRSHWSPQTEGKDGTLINGIKKALENMEQKFTDLSRLKFDDVDKDLKEKLQEQKIQERPFAYEFYHQFRKFYDDGSIKDFISEDIIPQAEVHKGYQKIPNLNRMPDFILHKTGFSKNLAVIEFKLASNLNQIDDDFEKLTKFRKVGPSYSVEYEYLIEVIIGNPSSLNKAGEYIRQLWDPTGEDIIVIEFNADSWKADDFRIKYKSKSVRSRNVI